MFCRTIFKCPSHKFERLRIGGGGISNRWDLKKSLFTGVSSEFVRSVREKNIQKILDNKIYYRKDVFFKFKGTPSSR
jgi:hypothetical protein